MTTITSETAALLDTYMAEARTLTKALRRAHYAKTKAAAGSDRRYSQLVGRIAALAGTTNKELNNLLIEETNEDFGLPRDFDRWANAGTERPTIAEQRKILGDAGLLDVEAACKAVAAVVTRPAVQARKKAVSKAKAKAKNPARVPGQAHDGTVEHYTCILCGAGFSKVRTRGRKPTKCPTCRTPEA